MKEVYTLTCLVETRDDAPYVGVIGTFEREEDAKAKMQELAEIEKKDFMDKYDCDEDDIGVEELYWMIAIFSPKDNAVTTYEIHNGYLL